MRGETTASPRATVRMAWASSCGGTSLRRNPLAPARSALKAYSSRSNVVRMSTWLNEPEAVMERVASMPSSEGMRTSMRTTSGS